MEMLLAPELMVAVVDQVMAIYRDMYYPAELQNGKMNLNNVAKDCLRISLATRYYLASLNIRSKLVAGSARWLVNPGFEFEYRFTADDLALMMAIAKAGRLPEIHCWVVASDGDDYIVDVAALLIPSLVSLDYREAWVGPKPVPIMRCGSRPRDGQSFNWQRASYLANDQATSLANFVAELIPVRDEISRSNVRRLSDSEGK